MQIGDSDVGYELTVDGLQTYEPPRLAAEEVEVEVPDVEYLKETLDRIYKYQLFGSRASLTSMALHLTSCEGTALVSDDSHMTCTGFVCYVLDYPSLLLPDDMELLWIGNGLKTKYALSAAGYRTVFTKLLEVRHGGTAMRVRIALLRMVARTYISLWQKWYGLRILHSVRKLNTHS